MRDYKKESITIFFFFQKLIKKNIHLLLEYTSGLSLPASICGSKEYLLRFFVLHRHLRFFQQQQIAQLIPAVPTTIKKHTITTYRILQSEMKNAYIRFVFNNTEYIY